MLSMARLLLPRVFARPVLGPRTNLGPASFPPLLPPPLLLPPLLPLLPLLPPLLPSQLVYRARLLPRLSSTPPSLFRTRLSYPLHQSRKNLRHLLVRLLNNRPPRSLYLLLLPSPLLRLRLRLLPLLRLHLLNLLNLQRRLPPSQPVLWPLSSNTMSS